MNPDPSKRLQIGCWYKSLGSYQVFEAKENNIIIFELRGRDATRTVFCFFKSPNSFVYTFK